MISLILRFTSVLLLITLIQPHVTFSCGPEFTMRAYLDRLFWQPLSKYEKSLDAASQSTSQANSSKKAKQAEHIFAGMATDQASDGLTNLRRSYRQSDYSSAKNIVDHAAKSAATSHEREEVMLVDAKIDLRNWEKRTTDQKLLRQANEKLQSFAKTARVPAWQSEARGWLARTHFLLEEYAPAAKIYLDELDSDTSVHSRDSLIRSLLNLFPYNGSGVRLGDHLEEYFDTPRHALFVVNIVTNPVYSSSEERKEMGSVARNVIASLQKHSELFSSGGLSDQLALSLMRAALYQGDTRAALLYSQWIPVTSEVTALPEFNWMIAACHFLQRDYRLAEAPLRAVLKAEKSTARDKSAAAQGLIGVYQKSGQNVEMLYAAFLYNSAEKGVKPGIRTSAERYLSDPPYIGFTYWPMGGDILDLPYLLDVQLSDDDLLKYLELHGRESRNMKFYGSWRRARTAYEMVQYALAVRYARQERYAESARLYESVKAQPRARRMRQLAGLYIEAVNGKQPAEKTRNARFAYAAFLEEHSTQIFFNDMVWTGFQTWAFLSNEITADPGFTKTERESLLKMEREVKDRQEERWRAYLLFKRLADEAGHSEFGIRATKKALKCLQLINTGRFGREEEIKAEQRRLVKWLREANVK